jgi:hypothetical protein
MTTTLPPKTTVKFVQLSPATTTLLAVRLAHLPDEMYRVKNTVVTFELQPGLVLQLLDELIRDEIPGAGPSGKNVKLLREVKRRLRDALAGMDSDHSKVQIVTEIPADPLREKILDLVAQIVFRTTNLDDVYDEAGDLADLWSKATDSDSEQMSSEDRDDFRAWLDDHL